MDRIRTGLERLRAEDGKAIAELARLVVADATATPLREIAEPRWIAGQIAAAVEAATHSDVARDWTKRRLAEARARWENDPTRLADSLPEEAIRPLKELLGHAYSPNEALVLRIIDQDAMRNLIRTVLTGAFRRFGRRLRDVESSVIGDLGSRARRRGRALFGNVTDNLGGLAQNLVGAVKEELDQVLEGRVRDSVGAATTEAVKVIARYIADPTHADGFASFRLAILEVVLDTPLGELKAEVEKMDPDKGVDVVFAALRSAVQRETFVEETTERIEALLAEVGDGTLGAWLREVGLHDVWTETTTELVSARLGPVVRSTAFEAWWNALFAAN